MHIIINYRLLIHSYIITYEEEWCFTTLSKSLSNMNASKMGNVHEATLPLSHMPSGTRRNNSNRNAAVGVAV